ncbi:DNA-binding response regulator, OmpR family, contains REC and winged-helix (wHTH) domain [Paenibacillus algorifonticola]|uniref:Heme response regulator HssR n=1 Tax=Paenibacillus algorifonticola TaxID=684063 RepID=A0A1I2J164_9BACL|nr:response regulator transcription factor [Paenibacillus algorifonticola]SFF46481.1 DNA-binding response regulator, OmpR family, contains REC and winged-helix (wHTH) domain [Paenibacillus algorifonticola]
MASVMLVDDDPDIRELMHAQLSSEGFQTIQASHGIEAIRLLRKQKADLVVLDVMMPFMDGWELCKYVKEEYPNIPVLMVTAKREINQKIKAFGLGTDDYMVKPFEPYELVLRVRALLKRYRIEASMRLQLGDFVLDRHTFEVMQGQARVALPLKEFELLFKLAGNPGKIFTRNELISQIWGPQFFGDERTVDVHIKRLRERFAEMDAPFTIVTKRGLGYRLEMVDAC